jgi:hypothetical protein
LRQATIALLAVPVLFAVYVGAALRRSTLARFGFALGLAFVLGIGIIGRGRLSTAVATTPTPILPLTQAAFSTTFSTNRALTEPVTIQFSTAMDPGSVAAAISVDPPTPIALAWDASATPAPTAAPTAAPTTGLVITAVGPSNITQTDASISWTVSAPATGQVEYGTTLAYGSFSALENSYIYTTHIQQLSGLAAGTLFHYRTHSTDAAGNSAVSADYTFTTLTPAPTPTPAPTLTPTPTPSSTAGPFQAPVTTQTVYVPTTIDSTGATNAAAALQSFIGTVPDGSVIVFKAGGVYRMDLGIAVENRHNLVFEGNGATLRANGSSGSMWADPFVFYGSPTTVSDIVIRDFTLQGNNPHTGTAIYDPSQEGQHGVGVYGGTRIEIANNTIRNTWGDGVYAANGSTQDWVDGLWVHDNTFAYIGRIVFTMNAVRNALLERNTIDMVGGSLMDIEPDLDYQGASNITLRDNTTGTWGMTTVGQAYWVGCANQTAGLLSVVSGVTITGNVVSSGPYPLGASSKSGGLSTWIGKPARQTSVVFTNNTTTKAGAGPVLIFEHVDGLTVTGNTQPLTSGSLTYVYDSTNVVSQ